MKKLLFYIVLLWLTISLSNAQEKEIYIPIELQRAYESNTRSYTGAPGEKYFQNSSDYTIRAEFDPESGYLKGKENITYYNKSEDTLSLIVIRLYQNFFKKGFNRDFPVPSIELHDGVIINELKVDGNLWNEAGGPQLLYDQGTNIYVQLMKPIEPGQNREITIDWEVQLPTKMTVRMGQYGKGNWFVGYWYPQIAVYDDISGWDNNAFSGSAEYYLDFNNYDVEITTPENYMLWATGDLQEPEKHYKKEILERLEKAINSNKVIHVVEEEDIINDRVLKRGLHAWHFTARDVPDFAFATSKTYLWDATSAVIDESNNRTAVHAVYKRNSIDFHEVAQISKEIIEHFSSDVFGIPFPYPKMVAFNGGGGMEYPMMINDGDSESYQGTVHLTAHEIGHSYFPFYVGTNEAYYAFMDEGLISFLPRETERKMIQGFEPFEEIIKQFAELAGNMQEVPLMTKSFVLSDYRTYRLHAYTRSANAFYFLRELMGTEKFNEAMQLYMKRWARKHPTPYDFFFTFEEVAGEDLSWYWNPWFFEFGYPDLAIELVSDHEVVISKKGNIPVPLKVTIWYEDGNLDVICENLRIWKNTNQIALKHKGGKVKKVTLGDKLIPDSKPGNNQLTVH